MTSHQLTLRSASQVTTSPQDGCQDTATSRQCEGELSGRSYTWAQENPTTNYILFILGRRASISEVNLTYSTNGGEAPKVSVCAAKNDTNINNAFDVLKCQEISIVVTGGVSRTDTIVMPFSNVTNRVALEIITQGIKASFTATAVQLFGTVEVTGKNFIIKLILKLSWQGQAAYIVAMNSLPITSHHIYDV